MLLAIDMQALINSLNLMWQGMLGIFVGMVTIALLVVLFTKVPALLKRNKE